MGFGKLSPAQENAIRPLVAGKVVHDLGAGDERLAYKLVQLGAGRVIAIDVASWNKHPPRHPAIVRRCQDFADFRGRASRVFLSWPDEVPSPDLLRIVKCASLVVYLGKTTDGTMCGWPDLFRGFAGREILRHLPERQNTLTCYGRRQLSRLMTGEEYAGIFLDTCLGFEEAEELAGLAVPVRAAR